MDSSLKADFALVSSTRMYFGHQSVGANIMDGLHDLQAQIGEHLIHVGELGVLDTAADQGVLLHTKVGENGNPASKCADFRLILDQKLLGRVDVALFKFCYVDFNGESDVAAIFTEYVRTMDDLKQRHPHIVFLHVTAPLRSLARGPGVWIREALGRPNRSKLANVRRNEFNRLLKDRYSGDPIFDLAGVMATYPDERRESFKMDRTEFDSLVPAYTNDGGHLNAVGRTYAAAAFVRKIAEALRAKRPQTAAALK